MQQNDSARIGEQRLLPRVLVLVGHSDCPADVWPAGGERGPDCLPRQLGRVVRVLPELSGCDLVHRGGRGGAPPFRRRGPVHHPTAGVAHVDLGVLRHLREHVVHVLPPPPRRPVVSAGVHQDDRHPDPGQDVVQWAVGVPLQPVRLDRVGGREVVNGQPVLRQPLGEPHVRRRRPGGGGGGVGTGPGAAAGGEGVHVEDRGREAGGPNPQQFRRRAGLGRLAAALRALRSGLLQARQPA